MRERHSIAFAIVATSCAGISGCIATPDGDPVAQSDQLVDSGASVSIATLAHSGSCLDAQAGGTANGTQIQEWSCNGSGAQIYTVQAAGGAFTLVNGQSKRCIDVAANGNANGTKIQLYDCNQTSAQLFLLNDAGNGLVTIVSTHSGKCLDVAANAPQDGTLIQLYDCNGTNAQKWRLTTSGTSGGSSGGSGGAGTGGTGGADAGTGTTSDAGGAVVTTPPSTATSFFVHYMAWFAAKPKSPAWGWHWNMGNPSINPDVIQNGKRQIASQFYPAIGPYDSGDADVLEYHVLLMKYAGIRGTLVDWYGIDDPQNLDYGMQTRNAQLLFSILKKAGLQFGVVYEDQSLRHEIDLGDIAAGDAFADGQRVMQWLNSSWFADPSYVRFDGKPLLLNFGPQFFKASSDWSGLFSAIPSPPAFMTLHSALAPAATGSFYWPEPDKGTDGDRAEYVTELPHITVPAAYPRFADFYAQAGIGASYGSIEDRSGSTYTDRLSLSLSKNPRIVQLVTWNDWGEGTNIEPSAQFGTRDLEATQHAVQSGGWSAFPWTADHLKLPLRLYNARKARPGDGTVSAASDALMSGDPAKAATILSGIGL